ncbi:MAG: [Bacteroides sp.]|nr:[FeFe] hydrogenase H-cluster radical SAM maturase HydE [Bacteroides sp.]
MKNLVDRLRSRRTLTVEEYKQLLLCRDAEVTDYLHRQVREETFARFGNKIFIRGLIEITNRCRNNCYYCGIRKSN